MNNSPYSQTKCECGSNLVYCILCGEPACVGDYVTSECRLTFEQELYGEVCIDCSATRNDLPYGFGVVNIYA